MAKSDYRYLDFVKLVTEAARVRTPLIQPSAIREFTDAASEAVTAGDVTQIDNETIVGPKGMSPEAFVDDIVSRKTWLLVPPEAAAVQDDVWTSGSLTKQAARWTELRAVFHQPGKIGDDLASAALAAEAAVYGAKVGSTVPGVTPGAAKVAAAKSADDNKGSPNPWNKDAWHWGEEARQKKIQSIIRMSTKMASSLAKAAGVDLAGRPLRAVQNQF